MKVEGPAAPPFQHAFRVALHDIDAAGIMFYGHLFRHAHDAYEAFMGAIGFPLERIIASADPLLPLVHAEADYHLPLHHGEALCIALGVLRIGSTSFTLDYRFLDGDSQLRARVRTVHVRLSPDHRSSAALPPALVLALNPWQCKTDCQSDCHERSLLCLVPPAACKTQIIDPPQRE
jgi:1,4-dihydroxy-2-naphthoyl-CoA hydrolase